MVRYVELNNDQRREMVNSRQRFDAWRNALRRERGYRGSMTWEKSKGHVYLIRSYYEESGKRRQKSLGRRTADTELLKDTFEAERTAAIDHRKNLDEAMVRQAAINRALGLGRVPVIAARILRMLDERELLGKGLRVAGTNALYSYEAACGVFIDPGLTSTEDIDLLFDSRSRLTLAGDADLPERSLIGLLRTVDRSFTKTDRPFRAENRDAYLVDLIKPLRKHPWREERSRIGSPADLEAAEIRSLVWLESAPTFEQVAIDERGFPVRVVSIDPRVFAVHKYWLSTQPDRDPLKKKRDLDQALTAAQLVIRDMPHLSLEIEQLRMIPREIVRAALDSFSALSNSGPGNSQQ
jgi:hypothetical protein